MNGVWHVNKKNDKEKTVLCFGEERSLLFRLGKYREYEEAEKVELFFNSSLEGVLYDFYKNLKGLGGK